MYSKRELIDGFSSWLSLQNYVEYSLETDPKRLTTFIIWMQTNGAKNIDQISGNKVREFFKQLSETKSKKTGEVLSLATQRNYLTTINRFARYLRQTDQGNIEVPIKFQGRSSKPRVVLSKAEVKQIYDQCGDSLLGVRDRAILAIFYGCGMRRNEEANLKIKDILPDKNLLYISKGKGYKPRYVPIVGQVKKDILNYLIIARPMLVQSWKHEYFMVGISGNRLSGSSMYERVRSLVKQSGIEKKVGLHSLRHSIATHLLVGGMKLSEIAKFLGHSSLESTQIYTHLKDEL